MFRHIAVVGLMLSVASGFLFVGERDGKPSNEEFMQKAQKIQMPFIANEGQADKRVKYYAKTFGGTVYVTKEGGIVYMLPKREAGAKEDRKVQSRTIEPARGTCYVSAQCAEGAASLFSSHQWVARLNNKWWQEIAQKASVNDSSMHTETSPRLRTETHTPKLKGVALKEELVGGKIGDISGEKRSGAVVSYFKGNDPSKWKIGLATYEMVSMGEVYKGIELKLKAHGDSERSILKISPSSKTTDKDGEAAFEITAKKKTGKAKVAFIVVGDIQTKITVEVVKQ